MAYAVRPGRWSGRGSVGGVDREAHAHAGVARPGLDLDRPAVAIDDDAVGDVEAQAGPAADVLGRVERLERSLLHLRAHARAGVTDLDDDGLSVETRRDGEGADAAHGVDGVVDEVGPDLVELARHPVDERYVCSRDGHH